MSGSNRRRASDASRRRGRRRLPAIPLGALLLLLLPGPGIGAASAGEAETAALPLSGGAGGGAAGWRLAWAPGVRPTPELERHLRADQAWLERLPPAARIVQWPAAVAPARELVRRLAGGGSGAEAARGARDLLSRLRERWLERGHLLASCAADSVAGTAARGIEVRVAPGPPFHNGAVAVAGPEFPGRERLLATWLPRLGDAFRPRQWDETIDRLLAGAGDAGHPFARWTVQRVHVDSAAATVDVEATLFIGARATLGGQTSTLPGGRGQTFLERATGLRRGEVFQQSRLARARQRLLARGLYAEVGEPEVRAAGSVDTVLLHWPVAPRARPNRAAAVLGFSRRQDQGGARLSGQVDLLLPNLAGTGRRLALLWSDDGSERARFGLEYLEPLALGSPLDLETRLESEVVQEVYTRLRADLRARLPVVAAWGVEVGLGWDRGTYPAGPWTRTARVRARGAFLHRRLDPARSGWEGVFALETARREAEARTDSSDAAVGTLAPLQRQRLLEAEAQGELFLRPDLSLAARGAVAEVGGEGGQIAISEQYRFGGARTLRGHLEGQFRGERVAYGSLECRLGNPLRSRLYMFYDLGYFRFETREPLPDDPERRVERSGTVRGFGLGIETRAAGGDISLAVGFPGSFDFDLAKLHVALLQAF